MSGTPQLRSAYPSTPQTGLKPRPQNATPQARPSLQRSKSRGPTSSTENGPVIPFSFLDAPSQRLYVSLLYSGLFLWRIFDFLSLPADGGDGFWLFTKWVGIDTAFLYSLSGLNIPWLQWSSSTFTILFILHAILDWMLMFQIPIPLLSWLGILTKVIYDREYAISERYVKPASILHNSSVILGKQIIHILPEGSAILNPNGLPFCIGDHGSNINLPIRINQTRPISIDIMRVDLDTNIQETIRLSAKELKKLQKNAVRDFGKPGPADPLLLHYTVRQTGLYRLQSVVDESSLEVQRLSSQALIVQCPKASIHQAPRDRCLGELSNFFIQVEATPPLRVKYSKTVNRDDRGHTVLSLQPDNLDSPLLKRSETDTLVIKDSEITPDMSWAKPQVLRIPLNESFVVGGGWQYRVDEVYDGCGNGVNYTEAATADSRLQSNSKRGDLEQHFFVHERPKGALQGCDVQNPLKVERGKPKTLPIHISGIGSGKAEDGLYSIEYLFTPEGEVLPDQRHPTSAELRTATIKSSHHGTSGISIQEPGLYSISRLRSEFCEGEIIEPSSCQLINPAEPDLAISAEQIPDKCAGSSIGLSVDLDLIGTPPFWVRYNIKPRGGPVTPRVVKVDRFHTQIELKPEQAGHYTYEFDRIGDAVYTNPRSLVHKNLVLEQAVKPPASARFSGQVWAGKACIGEPVSFNLALTGESPFLLEYELVHRGRRLKRTVKEIAESLYELKTEPLMDGGDYVLALTTITDATGCKQSLDAETTFQVVLQRPRASFGLVEGRRSIAALEDSGVKLPLRLQGEPPFRLGFRQKEDPSGIITEQHLWSTNGEIEVKQQGVFELVSVHDASCPGSVDINAKDFSVNWVPRPKAALSNSPLIDLTQNPPEKKAVCEGDEDATGISFTGTAPYDVQYEANFRSDRGLRSTSTKKFTAGLDTASLKMETTNSGLYTYNIFRLGDASYKHNAQKFLAVSLQQRVFSKPEASFVEAGKTYKYCKDAEGVGEDIPIHLNGAPPFQLELEIKHLANSKPERINVANLETTQYDLRLPQRVLALGSHSVSIRKIQDANGCQRITDYNGPHVQVSVADVPSISPLEDQSDFCVGDRISYALSGTPPFNVFYTFQGRERKAKVPNTDFRRLAEQPGEFIITAISDSRSTDACRAKVVDAKTIHEMPSVRVSKGKVAVADIHQGGEADILFEFGGVPPFHFTYTRSTVPPKGKKPTILETKHGVSNKHSMTIKASEEGLYEVVSIRDRYCAYSAQQAQVRST